MPSGFRITDFLNTASRGAGQPESQGLQQIEHISVYDLIPSSNTENFYDMTQIDNLKESVEMFGVQQNLLVKPNGDGTYKVIAGHRRRLACLALAKEGKTEFEQVPCSILTDESDLVAQILLISTNATTRRLTGGEMVRQAAELRRLFEEYKKTENIPGRTRDMIAAALGTSAAQVGRMDAVERHLIPEFKEELQAGRMNLSTAYELSSLSEDAQKAAFREYQKKGKMSIKDARIIKEPLPPPPHKQSPRKRNTIRR